MPLLCQVWGTSPWPGRGTAGGVRARGIGDRRRFGLLL